MNNLHRRIILLITFLFLLVPLFSMDFHGTFFADYYGSIEPNTEYSNLRNRIYYQPDFSGVLFNNRIEYNLSANLFYDPSVGSSLFSSKNFIAPENILKEAYLFLSFSNFDLSIGQKTVSPGMADVFSPLDTINGGYAYKLSLDDPYEGSRADLMVQLQYYPSFDDSLQVVYVPFPRPDYERTKVLNMTYPDINIDFNFNSDPYLVNSPNSIFISYNHSSSGFDLQLDYAYYTEQTPNFDLSNLANGASLTGTVSTLYTRNHTFGGAYSTSFSGITIVEELAANLTEDFDGAKIGIKNSDITLNSQVTGTIFGSIFAQLNIVYQYIINFDKSGLVYSDSIDSELADEFNTYFNQPQQHIAFAIAHFHRSFLREKLYTALNVAYLYPEFYIAPRIAYSLSDRMKIETGADINTGEPSSMALALRGNLLDNYYLRLKYEY